mmetsp:Transcript_21750/g.53258  ORF Transcript_21750/g.53258 Transcript_21750/m.53258 type:complete len:591 (+) Transcript_21750:207-1979(+)
MSEGKKTIWPTPYSAQGIEIGVLGGGQLGRMMAEAAHRLGLKLQVVDPKGQKSPAGQIGFPAIEGSFQERKNVEELGKRVKLITVEIEHINTETLHELEGKGWDIHPSAKSLSLIQDKYAQKKYFYDLGIPCPEFMPVESHEDMKKCGEKYGFPFMLKCRRQAYDGRGNAAIRNPKELDEAWEKFGKLGKNALYVEKWCPYVKELAVMVARGANGQLDAYPVVETVQKDNICHLVLAPAQVSQEIALAAREMAMSCVGNISGRGIYGVELFVTADGKVFYNEMAPRPHNSGHYTMEACMTDQFEQHLRAVAGLPLGSCEMRVPVCMMLNVLGEATETFEKTYEPLQNALKVPGAGIHFYGKDGVRKGRKLAHTTVVAKDYPELFAKADEIVPGASEQFKKTSMEKGGERKDEKAPLVGIIMGSDSDLPTMKAAARYLEKFDVPYELTVVSAHRTPRRMFAYATSAVSRGLKVIIAGAGGAAHLPGMVAALTPLPVIGVPVKTSTLSGVDSLHSIVQMPRGIPVATVAIGNATNAGLLAVRCLGLQDSKLLYKMQQFMGEQEEEVYGKINKMEEKGWKTYLDEMPVKKTAV